MSVRIRGNIIGHEGIIEGATLIASSGGRIEGIDSAYSGPVDLDASGLLVAPGFVDLHVHGGGGADFMDATPDAVRAAARTHARHGTTTLLATTLTASREHVTRCIAAVREVMDSPGKDEAAIAGLHLEGPYICAAKRGAQPLAPIRPPDWEETAQWQEEAAGAIRLMTLAPEIPGALEFIARARAAGLIVSIGHTDATYDEARAALEAGAAHATHLFNAMPPLHHRSPGPVAALLQDARVLVELICDGVHVHPAIVRLAAVEAGADRVILITDAISGADMPDGLYQLGGTPVQVREGEAKFGDGTLAGSVLTMEKAFWNVQSFAGVSPWIAARMSSLNAARQLGMEADIGSLAPGKYADLAILDPASGAVAATMRRGEWIWRS